MSKAQQLSSLTNSLTPDASGNLGVGVTPDAWGAFKVVDFQGGGAIASYTASPSIQSINNAYFDGANWKYKTSNFASRYLQDAGTHQWATAASGTAGNNVTFTQNMTLDASGNLGIGGVTNPASYAAGASYSVFAINGTNGSTIALNGGGTNNLLLYTPTGGNKNIYFGSMSSSGSIIFGTNNNTERARINSTGELLVGTTSNIGVGAKVALSSSGNVLHIQSSNSGSNNLVSYDSGGAATFYVSNGGSVVTTNTTRSGEGYLSPLFFQNTGVGYLDLSQGDIYNIKDVSSPGNLNAMFNGQFSPYTQSDESMSWQKFRVIFRCTRNSPTYDTPTVTFRCVNHFYASGWTEQGASFDFNGTDGERGYRWVVSPWYDYTNLGGGFDVPGWGIKLKTSSIAVRIGSVFIQYRR